MIERDHTSATYVASTVLTLGLFFSTSLGAGAAEQALAQPLAVQTVAAAPISDAAETSYWTQFGAAGSIAPVRAKTIAHPAPGGPLRLADAARASFRAALRVANSVLRMMATAYTAGCYGCSGITATGSRAGHGIVAVDPSIIPLGTKLYVPGYGRAIAGDTGGDIRGRRIDLGFDSLADAMRFGRREITVYVLR